MSHLDVVSKIDSIVTIHITANIHTKDSSIHLSSLNIRWYCTSIPLPGLDSHGLPGFVEEGVEERPVAHEEQPLQAGKVSFQTGYVHQEAVQSTVHQGVCLRMKRWAGPSLRLYELQFAVQ